jgi:hypothetical protein
MIFNPLSKAYLEEVRQRCEAATPGPWVSYVEGRDHLGGDSVIVRGTDGTDEGLYLTHATVADQDFIAHARQDIPTLLDEIERLRELLNLENAQGD